MLPKTTYTKDKRKVAFILSVVLMHRWQRHGLCTFKQVEVFENACVLFFQSRRVKLWFADVDTDHYEFELTYPSIGFVWRAITRGRKSWHASSRRSYQGIIQIIHPDPRSTRACMLQLSRPTKSVLKVSRSLSLNLRVFSAFLCRYLDHLMRIWESNIISDKIA